MSSERQYCTFTLADGFFGIEVSDVQEVLREMTLTPVPLAHGTVRGLINLRGQIVTAIDLRRRLELEARPDDENPMNIVVRTPDGAVSLLVDKIGDVLVVDAEMFEAPPETIVPGVRELLAGVSQLEDRLLLVLDLAKTVELTEPTARETAGTAS